MAILTSAGITFGDATTQSTAATAAALVTTANVLSATAGATAGAVGTYAFVNQRTSGTTAFNSTRAGSSLQPCGIDQAFSGFTLGSSQSGTWRCMGDIPASGFYITLFLRIS